MVINMRFLKLIVIFLIKWATIPNEKCDYLKKYIYALPQHISYSPLAIKKRFKMGFQKKIMDLRTDIKI
jgi:hypothetical protein